MTASDKYVSTYGFNGEADTSPDTSTLFSDNHGLKLTWKHLFSFTKPAHMPVLMTALITSCLAAALKSSLAVVLGKIFDVVAAYGQLQKSSHQTLSEVSWWCIILTIMGAGAWGVNAAYLAFWITFGEQQARSCRLDIFETLAKLKHTWFDVLPRGIPSLFVTMQTSVRQVWSTRNC